MAPLNQISPESLSHRNHGPSLEPVGIPPSTQGTTQMRFALYRLDDWGRPLAVRMVDCESVEEAKQAGLDVLDENPVEIWDDQRRIARFQRTGGKIQVFE